MHHLICRVMQCVITMELNFGWVLSRQVYGSALMMLCSVGRASVWQLEDPWFKSRPREWNFHLLDHHVGKIKLLLLICTLFQYTSPDDVAKYDWTITSDDPDALFFKSISCICILRLCIIDYFLIFHSPIHRNTERFLGVRWEVALVIR